MAKNYRSQPHRKECPEYVQLITSKCAQNRLWFVNNPAFHERIHAFLAKYTQAFGVELLHFEIVGNHYHLLARFPHSNTSRFMQHFNARIAQAAKLLVKEYQGGNRFFARRFSTSYIPDNADVIKYFFYCALQCVSSKLSSTLGEYPQKTLTSDAIRGISRTYRFFEFGRYKRAKRSNPSVSRRAFWKEHTLEFARVPGHDELSAEEYSKVMFQLLEIHRQELLRKLGPDCNFLGEKALREVVPGSLPHSSKSNTRRPIVLTLCSETRKQVLSMYFSFCEKFKEASTKLRAGGSDVIFPEGMYRPPGNTFLPA